MFSNLKIGTKIVAVVVAVIILGIGILSTVIAMQSSKILHIEAYKTLETSAYRYRNLIKGYTESVYISLLGAESSVRQILSKNQNIDEKEIETILSGIIDTNPWVEYIYFHTNNTSQFKNLNSTYFTQSNKFLMLLYDTDLLGKGGVKLIQAEDRILNQQSVNAALNQQKEAAGRPQIFTIGGRNTLAYNVVIPIISNGKTIGIIGALAGLDVVQKNLTDPSRSVFKNDQRLLIGDNGLLAVHPDAKLAGKNIKEINSHPSASLMLNLQKNKTDQTFDYTSVSGIDNKAYIATFNLWEGSDNYWSVAILAPVDSIEEPIDELIISIIAVSAF
ncbi:cache domain-containing protein, partial [Campylobacter peloridis]